MHEGAVRLRRMAAARRADVALRTIGGGIRTTILRASALAQVMSIRLGAIRDMLEQHTREDVFRLKWITAKLEPTAKTADA